MSVITEFFKIFRGRRVVTSMPTVPIIKINGKQCLCPGCKIPLEDKEESRWYRKGRCPKCNQYFSVDKQTGEVGKRMISL